MTNRPLGHLERMITLTDDHFPLNIAIVLHLAPAPPLESIQKTLAEMQARHPILRARIHGRKDYRLIYDVDRLPTVGEIQTNPDLWQGAAEQVLNQHIDRATGPLFRCVALNSPDADRSALILGFHHAIIDASSLTRLLNEFLSHLAGSPSDDPPGPPMEAIEARFPAAFQGWQRTKKLLGYLTRQTWEEAVLMVSGVTRHFPPAPAVTANRVLTTALTESETRTLVRQARQNDLTLHTVLNAALACATNQVLFGGRPGAHRLTTFTDLRPYLDPPLGPEILGNAISFLRILAWHRKEESFWDFARRVQPRLLAALRRGDKFSANLLSDRIMIWVLRMNNMRLGTTALSYTGPLDLPESAGHYQLHGLNAFISNNRVGPIFAAQTRLYRDRLFIDALYLEPEITRDQAQAVLTRLRQILTD